MPWCYSVRLVGIGRAAVLATPLSAHDCVIFLDCAPPEPLQTLLAATAAHFGAIYFSPEQSLVLRPRCVASVVYEMTAPELHVEVPLLREFVLKLAVNAVSTGANVLKGTVYGNAMINLTLSNNKLFQRSVEIVNRLTAAPLSACQNFLLRSIYRSDTIDLLAMSSQPLSTHIEVATLTPTVIPVAVLLATGRFTVQTALNALRSGSSLRALIASALTQ